MSLKNATIKSCHCLRGKKNQLRDVPDSPAVKANFLLKVKKINSCLKKVR